jgi:uncharacterized membrane protein YczE
MKAKELFLRTLISISTSFITMCLVTLIWNLVIKKSGAIVDWKNSLFIGIFIGISLVFPLIRRYFLKHEG